MAAFMPGASPPLVRTAKDRFLSLPVILRFGDRQHKVRRLSRQQIFARDLSAGMGSFMRRQERRHDVLERAVRERDSRELLGAIAVPGAIRSPAPD